MQVNVIHNFKIINAINIDIANKKKWSEQYLIQTY